MVRCRFRVPPLFLAVMQLGSLAVISYLARENATLKEEVNRISISAENKLASCIMKSRLKVTSHPNYIIPNAETYRSTTKTNKLARDAKLATNYVNDENTIPINAMLSGRVNTALPAHTRQPREFSPSMLTIIIHETSKTDFEIYLTREHIRNLLPDVKLLWSTNEAQGKSLNTIIAQVETEYFLVLEEGVKLSSNYNESIVMLWDALERNPEIDFIGGSYLATGEKLYVACHRYRLCNWTFSESYEYERSLGTIMICDGTSSSFMGRRESVRKVTSGFDADIGNTLIITDFFLRAKLSKNVVVGTLPNVMFLVDNVLSLYELWQERNITQDLIPFAVKYKVFKFKDDEDNTIDMCSATSPLSGKYFCNEKVAHDLMLNGGHWAYNGTFAYPYMLNYLETTLSEVTNFLEKHNVNYVIIGGVTLGAVKTRTILPWEAGDIDFYVYGISLVELLRLFKPWARKNGYIAKLYENEAVHVFCTPKDVGEVSGGLATLHPFESEKAPEFIRIKTNGMWVRYDRKFYQQFLEYYGEDYLQHKAYRSEESIECKIKDHNACLPNFKFLYQGRAGTLKDFFCRS